MVGERERERERKIVSESRYSANSVHIEPVCLLYIGYEATYVHANITQVHLFLYVHHSICTLFAQEKL